jgi:catechol 2,3-dioxygenase-like lactoylglutathione lyase family enzyme
MPDVSCTPTESAHDVSYPAQRSPSAAQGAWIAQENLMLQHAPMYSYIPAKDVERARRFYEDKLGFVPSLEVSGGVVYEFAKGTACFLYPSPNAGTSQASQAFWDVEDVVKEVSELKRRGVALERYDLPGMDENGIATAGGAKAAWFKDSEGNIMAVVQSLETPRPVSASAT